jgi:hypothetical protein
MLILSFIKQDGHSKEIPRLINLEIYNTLYYNTWYYNLVCFMKNLKIKKFNNEANKMGLSDEILIETFDDFLKLSMHEQLKFSLGAGLYKLRIATSEGRGKSGGSRSILAYKKDNGIFWLHLFAKNDKENVTTSELKKLKQLANIMLELNEEQINKLIKLGELCEVNRNV